MPKQCSTEKLSAKRSYVKKDPLGPPEIRVSELRSNGDEKMEGFTEQVRRFVLEAWPGIVQGLIQKAMSGGYQQTKLLLELCELDKQDDSPIDEDRKRQLCDALLEGLGWSPTQADEQTALAGPRQELENSEAL